MTPLSVTLFSGNGMPLPPSMRVYREAILDRLRQEHPEVSVREHYRAGVGGLLGSGMLGRYLGYFPSAFGMRCRVAHILDQNNAPLALMLPRDTFVVQTVHDFHPSFFKQPGHLLLKAQGLGICRADRIVTPSDHTAADLSRALRLDSDRIRVCPNGLDAGRFRFDSPVDSGRDKSPGPGRPMILHVGSEAARKDIPVLLQAFSGLRRRFPRARLLRVGTAGPEALRWIDRLGLRAVVEYREGCDDAEVARLYREADLLLFPSRYEGFGLPVLEAMASGCPVVTSGASSLPEVGGDAVLYAAAGDIQGFTEAAASVLTNPGRRRRLIAAGLDRARGFTWSAHVEALVDLYRQGTIRPHAGDCNE